MSLAASDKVQSTQRRDECAERACGVRGRAGACELLASLGVPLTPQAVLQTCSSERLRALNIESEACLAKWRIQVAQSPELGRYLLSATGVPAGETAMVLPPNRILRFEDVRDYNTVIQARYTAAALHTAHAPEAGARRFGSASTSASGCTVPA